MYSETTYSFIEALENNKQDFEIFIEYAKTHNVPIMRPIVSDFLKTMVVAKNPKNILEIGTAIGYSGCVMLSCLEMCKLTTIELNSESYELAKENFERLNFSHRVEQHLGDSGEIIEKINDKFDLVFLDGAKGQYVRMLPRLIDMLNDGGLLVADNVLFRGQVSGEEKLVPRKKTIVKRLKEFLYMISNHEKLQTVVLPFEDGVSVSVKK